MDTLLQDDPSIQAFWAAAERGSLRLQHCGQCGYVRWPAAPVCPECLGRSFAWKEVEGRGTVWSFVVYHRAYKPALEPFVPYNVALVELACGVRLVTHIVDCDASQIRVGQHVEVDFRRVFGGRVAPVFRAAAEHG